MSAVSVCPYSTSVQIIKEIVHCIWGSSSIKGFYINRLLSLAPHTNSLHVVFHYHKHLDSNTRRSWMTRLPSSLAFEQGHPIDSDPVKSFTYQPRLVKDLLIWWWLDEVAWQEQAPWKIQFEGRDNFQIELTVFSQSSGESVFDVKSHYPIVSVIARPTVWRNDNESDWPMNYVQV